MPMPPNPRPHLVLVEPAVALGKFKTLLHRPAAAGDPDQLPSVGAGEVLAGPRFDELAAMAVEDPTAGGNPVLVGAAQARRMNEDAWAGRGI